MPQAGHTIQFKFGSYAQYAQIIPDPNTIYFCTDTNQLFVGTTEYTRPVFSGDGAPVSTLHTNNPVGSFYYDSTNDIFYMNMASGWVAINNLTSADITAALGYTPANIVVCTQDEYDALDPRPQALYFIKEESV